MAHYLLLQVGRIRQQMSRRGEFCISELRLTFRKGDPTKNGEIK